MKMSLAKLLQQGKLKPVCGRVQLGQIALYMLYPLLMACNVHKCISHAI